MFAEELRQLRNLPSKAGREQVQARMRDRARANPDGLRMYLTGLRLEEEEHARTLVAVIESLGSDPTAVESVLVEQLDRVLALCRSDPPAAALTALSGFLPLERGGRPQFRDVLRVKYQSGLSSSSEETRRACVQLLGGYRVAAHPDLLMALRSLLDDPDWRVRSEAEWLLRDEGLLPERYRPRIGDRLRRTFLRRTGSRS